jgi:hypothetical protein
VPTPSRHNLPPQGYVSATFGGSQQQQWAGTGVAQAGAQLPYHPDPHVPGPNTYQRVQQHLPQPEHGMGGDGSTALTNQQLIELGQQLSLLRSPVKQGPKPDAQQVWYRNVLVYIFMVSCNGCTVSWC